jgi:hypothetical protein
MNKAADLSKKQAPPPEVSAKDKLINLLKSQPEIKDIQLQEKF